MMIFMIIQCGIKVNRLSDKSCIDPFYDEIYNNLKSFTSSKKEIKREKEATFAAGLIPTSSLLDTESDVEIGKGLLRS